MRIEGEENCDFKPIRLSETGRLAPSGVVAAMGELRFRSHRAFKHAPLLRVPLCVSWAFLV